MTWKCSEKRACDDTHGNRGAHVTKAPKSRLSHGVTDCYLSAVGPNLGILLAEMRTALLQPRSRGKSATGVHNSALTERELHMRIFTLLAAMAMSVFIAFTGAPAHAAVPTTQAPTTAIALHGSDSGYGNGGSNGLDPNGGLCGASCCLTVKYLHWTAEMLLDFLRLQPIFKYLDKPIIHPLLWHPLDQLTGGGCGADTHPPELS